MIKTYQLLTKPKIIAVNTVTTSAGFFLASKGDIDFGLFLATIAGLSLIIASAGVFNNFIDRGIDSLMERTKKRPLAAGLISGKNAIVFASILGLAGIAVLALLTNPITLLVALVGFFIYVAIYTFFKRRSVYGTLVGSISGAVPPVVGYTAASSRFDKEAFILFTILVLWQIPHFFAIAIYYLNDYAAAGIPVLPLKKSILSTKINILAYTIAFTCAALALTVLGYTGYGYLIVAALLCSAWLMLCIKGFRTRNNRRWSHQMFRFSLVVITVLSVTISVDAWLP